MLSNNSEINNILNNINMLNAGSDNQYNAKKSRGRPRKENVDEFTSVPIVEPKKRGRKPKENKPVTTKSITKNEEIVLHLPNISAADLTKHNITIKNNSTSKSDSEMSESNTQNTNIFTICDSDSDDSSSFTEKKELLAKIKTMEEHISKLESKLSEHNKVTSVQQFSVDKHNVTKMNINLIDHTSNEPVKLLHTDIACWWCTETFKDLPCFIVRDKKNGAFVVFGCFCSYNCAITYNMQIDDFKMWDRYSLTTELCNIINNTVGNVTAALPREVLKKFGGHMTIEEFRTNSKIVTKEFRCIMPPMIAIVPYIEESNKAVKKSIQEVNTSLNKNDDLVLKREHPLPNSKNNLLSAFNFHRRT